MNAYLESKNNGVGYSPGERGDQKRFPVRWERAGPRETAVCLQKTAWGLPGKKMAGIGRHTSLG